MIDTTNDCHVHTKLCGHAQGEMEEYVKAAIGIGLRRLIFLEHLEMGIVIEEKTWLDVQDFDVYFLEGERLREKYGQILDIRLGVETGYNPERADDIVTFLEKYQWDYIGISYHYVKIEGHYINVVSRRKKYLDLYEHIGIEKIVEQYFKGLLEAVDHIPGHALCHLDAVARHYEKLSHDACLHYLDHLLAGVARKGLAIEVNTSGFRLRGEPFPALPTIKKAMTMGIPLIAGSDAHRPQDVGAYFSDLCKLMEPAYPIS